MTPPKSQLPTEHSYALLWLQAGRVVEANPAAIRCLALPRAHVMGMTQADLLACVVPSDRERVAEVLAQAAQGQAGEPLVGVCLGDTPDDGPCLDWLAAPAQFGGQPAVQVVWVDRTTQYRAEQRLRQNLQRLQLLHAIDRDILANRDQTETVRAALANLAQLIPAYAASRVLLLHDEQAQVLAGDPPQVAERSRPLNLRALGVNLSALQDGLPDSVHDLAGLEAPQPVHTRLLALGVRSYLAVPMRVHGQMLGLLALSSRQPNAFQAEHVQIAQEAADSLSVAIQQERLRRAERQRQRETEVMRDIMTALAGANDLKSSLEALLVHLHGLIHYDRAGLFLVDENRRFVPAAPGGLGQMDVFGGLPGEPGPAIYPENDPLVADLRRLGRPLVVADAHSDPRFAQWPDLRAMHGWLGAPLLDGDEMLGFLSLSSLERSAYSPADADTMAMFASQVAQVLARTWQGEQSQRRTQELEVLSSITSALGQAERGENTLTDIVEQLAHFFGARRVALLAPDAAFERLLVQASNDLDLVGLEHPGPADWLWRTLEQAQTTVLPDVDSFVQESRVALYQPLLAGAQSALAIPLLADEAAFGVLLFAFEARRRFSAQDLRLFQAVAEMAAASLRRAVMLEGLEQQVRRRTQHLTTLYHINALSAQPLNLLALLEEVLYVTVAALGGAAGAIHFLDDKDSLLTLVAQNGLLPELLPPLEAMPAGDGFWPELLAANAPLVLADLATEAGLPPALQALAEQYDGSLMAAVRGKGPPLGVLSLFDYSIQGYSVEDITLFSTIADQLGAMVERARLMKQAELAAVVQERQRLARELHDSVTQLLYSQVLFAGATLKLLRRGEAATAEQHVQRIEQAAQQALREMRLLVYELRSSDELDEGLLSALERRLNAVEKRTGINARLVSSALPALDKPLAMALYRIAEEALNNTLKHAQAANVVVTLSYQDDLLTLTVQDDGRGFVLADGHAAGGMGLANISERAAALGGSAHITSAPGDGTQVRVAVQLACKPEDR